MKKKKDGHSGRDVTGAAVVAAVVAIGEGAAVDEMLGAAAAAGTPTKAKTMTPSTMMAETMTHPHIL